MWAMCKCDFFLLDNGEGKCYRHSSLFACGSEHYTRICGDVARECEYEQKICVFINNSGKAIVVCNFHYKLFVYFIC